MHVTSSSLSFASQHRFTAAQGSFARLNPGSVAKSPAPPPDPAQALTSRLAQLAKARKAAQPPPPPAPAANQADLATSKPSDKQQQVLDILNKVFGVKVVSADLKIEASHQHAVAASVQQSSSTSTTGSAFDYHASYQEYEESRLGISGTITTEDGRSFKVTLDWMQSRSFTSTTDISMRSGDAVDPLALDLTGEGIKFADQTSLLDLMSDGKPETVRQLGPNVRWLILDNDGDGHIDGRDLFGPSTGNGFRELAALDDDGNGWIDTRDAAFVRLALWDGKNAPEGLAKLDIGALGLGAVAAPFSHKDLGNQTVAVTRQAGLYLRNDGSPGALAQVDLVA